MKTILIAVALTGCATAAQSAHTLAPGKMEVTVAGSRSTTSNQQDDSAAIYTGQLMVRTGVADNADVGFSLTRTPGTNQNLWAVAVDPKFRFTRARARTTISFGVPLAVFFEDEPKSKGTGDTGGFDYGGVLAAPTLYVSEMVNQTTELLVAPRLYLIRPGENAASDTDVRVYVGGSIGVRITDRARHWAVTPEVAFTHVSAENDGGDSTSLLTLGVGISVGN